ncbi:MAG TPA: hypothetical protein VJM33_04295 [Microthrixaceae bacterium]|nr:hypothetical protein [Microthrixaceae bacterium]
MGSRWLRAVAVAGAVGIGALGLAGPAPAGATGYTFDIETRCLRSNVRVGVDTLFGVLWAAGDDGDAHGVPGSWAYSVNGFCGDYTLTHGDDDNGDGVIDPDVDDDDDGNLDVPSSYSGPTKVTLGTWNSTLPPVEYNRLDQWTTYQQGLEAVRRQVRWDAAAFGVSTAAADVLANGVATSLDVINWNMNQQLPKRVQVNTTAQPQTPWTGEQVASGPHTLGTGQTPSFNMSWNQWSKQFMLAGGAWPGSVTPPTGIGDGVAGANGSAVGLAAAGCWNGVAGGATGYILSGKYGSRWNAAWSTGCGIGAGVATADGVVGGLLLGGVSISYTADVFNVVAET